MKAYTLDKTNAAFTAGIDISKNHFQSYLVDEATGEVQKFHCLRSEFLEAFATRKPGIIAMESCGGSKHWARELEKLGHRVLLLNARHVKPFVLTCKDDKADALGIWYAMHQIRPIVRPHTLDQQIISVMNSLRQAQVRRTTQLINEVRSHLAEFGIVIPKTVPAFKRDIAGALEQLEAQIGPCACLFAVRKLVEEVTASQQQVQELDRAIDEKIKDDPRAKLFMTMPGVGKVIAANLISVLSDPSAFKNGRHFAAFLGLVPSHTGTGGKTINGSITKRGSPRLRSLLVQGAMSVLRKRILEPWVESIKKRLSRTAAAVALANRMARQLWAMASRNEAYRSRMTEPQATQSN